jgi:NAD(P)-dependent dehydrogenase (short-subunit alcohol dehydrogenase family)
MPTALITGANRGLGLEFTRQYVADGWKVLATCRDPEKATELNSISGEIQVLPLDVSDFLAIETVSRMLAAEKIDLLLNNAGVIGHRPWALGDTDYEIWTEMFRINTQAPLKMTECFVDQVARSDKKLIVSITSRLGSIDANDSGEQYTYRSTKAALNMVHKSISIDLADKGITAVVLHPGWVRTDMGGPNADIDPVDSVSGMRGVIAQLSSADSGKFFSYDGSSVDW